MHGRAFKEIELTDRKGEDFEGSAEFCWTASKIQADRETSEPGGWEAYASIAFAVIDGVLHDRDALCRRFDKSEVTRVEAYFEEEAFREELDEFDTIYDDDGAAFDAAAMIRAADPVLHSMAAE
ncbi:hypothetical protein [Leisingera sp. ANG-M7]|uniref:hypothetical protein n=1 Tax=Leisingera sp. ANG-M7 TaxID=1577902 RepID=UPI0005805E9E|nr:hypothetical protein [Leisingera sp. ANG-M7]KIC39380.1 hypothetical protein RA26_01640 [Leisingera sp. ANG-M7]